MGRGGHGSGFIWRAFQRLQNSAERLPIVFDYDGALRAARRSVLTCLALGAEVTRREGISCSVIASENLTN
jgi:hypothetical protein